MAQIDDLRAKRKSSLIVVCTLGLASLFKKDVRPLWMTNLFEGTSVSQNEGMAFVLKALSFLVLGAITAIMAFVIHLIKLIDYSIMIHRLSD